MTAAAVDYDRAINIVRGDNVEKRMELASNPHTPPEFLYYLSEDSDVGVRRAVGENPSTPGKADVNLSKDNDISVRCAVARKIVGAGLDSAARRDMWGMGYTILETLMLDTVVKVRCILSEALKSDANAPHQLVLGLARDRDETVAGPILRASPVLRDDDMVSILKDGPPGWVGQAIAGRDCLSPDLADTLIKQGETAAVASVIANPGSKLSAPVLEALVDRSETVAELQPPLVDRKDMPAGMLIKLAKFVVQPLLKTLCGRKDLDEESISAINKAIESRDDKPAVRAAIRKSRAKSGDLPADAETSGAAPPESPARRLFAQGSLTDDAVAVALERWENDFVIEALALRSGFPVETVSRMVRVKSARTIVSLAWKAGFSARFAMDLQRQLAHILPTKIVNARDGIDYALSVAEMETQLSLFD